MLQTPTLLSAAFAAAITALQAATAAPARDLVICDVFSEELARFEGLSKSLLPELRVAAARGLSSLGHRTCERFLLRLLGDEDACVRREAAFGLGRLGGLPSVETLIQRLEDTDPLTRDQSLLSLQRLTGWEPPADERTQPGAWMKLLSERKSVEARRRALEDLKSPAKRGAAFREIALLGGEAAEGPLLELHSSGLLKPEEIEAFFSALEKSAGPRSIPVLAAAAPRFPSAAWALGDIGGEAAERALLQALQSGAAWDLAILINLDRLRSKALYPFAPALLQSFGLVSYRGLPDDLHLDPTPAQRVAARLLLRSGKAGELVELMLSKLEGKTRADPGGLSSEARAIQALLDRMDAEIQPGFHRADSGAESMLLASLPHLAVDRALAPRLLALLNHPAFVVRVYAATALAKLRAGGAVPVFVQILHEGYPFPDTATQASGKHGPEVSGTVRWKGYLAMALGLEGSDAAREALEAFVTDTCAPRDIRFGSAVGLKRIADPRSRPALEHARDSDVVGWISKEAEAALEAIATREKAKAASNTVKPVEETLRS